ncbi:MAG: serine/threonine protein kinase, partial [Planctomycetota bacterium]
MPAIPSQSDNSDERAEELLLEFLGFTHDDVDSEFVDFCADNPDEAPELRRLYSAYNKLDENFGFFGGSTDSGESNYTEGARKGDSIGDFRLIAHIARGGQGEVWEAKQYSMQRRVALKLVLPGRINDKAL